jgi:hypothetical protein
VSLVLLVLCVLNVFTLAPGDHYSYSGSRVGNAIGSLFPPRVRGTPGPDGPPTVNIAWYPDSDEVRVVSRESERAWAVYYNIYASYTSLAAGWWGLTEETNSFTVMADVAGNPERPMLGPLPSDITRRVCDLYVAQINAVADPFWIDRVRRSNFGSLGAVGGSIEERRVLWAGWTRNAASVLLLLLLGYSSWWIVSRARAQRRWRRLACGVCPECRYLLGTLPPERPCPECGRPHPPAVFVRAPATPWDWFWRRVRTRYALAALTLVLVGDVLLLPRSRTTGSTLALWLHTPALRRDPGDGHPDRALRIGVHVRDGVCGFVDLGGETDGPPGGAGRPLGPSPAETSKAGTFDSILTCRRDSSSSGFWAPVRSMTYVSCSGDWQPLRAVDGPTAQVCRWLDEQGEHLLAWELRRAEHDACPWFRTRWSGHAHNALAMGAAFLWCCSWGWIPDRRSRSRWCAGRCGRCTAGVPDGADHCPLCAAPRASGSRAGV